MMKNDDSVAGIHVAESSDVKEIKPATSPAPPQENGGWKKGIVVFDFFLRLGGIAAAIAATSTMGTSDQTLPFFTQFFQFEARYDDLPTFQFFVVAMGTVSVYLILSLIVSVVCIVQPLAVGPRLFLLILDAVALTLASAAAGAGAALDYLAHNGNSNANWLAICNQFGDFCQKVSGAVVASFVSIVIFIFLVLFSALALKKP